MNLLVRNSFWYLFFQGIIFVVSLLASIVVARSLSPEGKGLYALAIILPNVLFSLLNFSIGPASIFYLASKRYDIETVLGNNLILGLIHVTLEGLVGLLCIIIGRAFLFPDVSTQYLFLALLILPGQTSMSFIMPIFMGVHDVTAYSLLHSLRVVLNLGLILVFSSFVLTVQSAIIAESTASLLTFIVAVILILRKTTNFHLKIDGSYIRDIYRYGIKLHTGSLMQFLNSRLNIIILGWLLSPTGIGLFTLSVGLSERIWLISDSIGAVLYPRISAETDNGLRNIITPLVFKTTVLLISICCVFFFIVGDWLIISLYSIAYKDSVILFRILLLGVITSSGWRILENDLKGRGKPAVVTIVTIFSVISLVFLDFVLIPIYGSLGAGYAMATASFLTLGIGLVAFTKTTKIPLWEMISLQPSDYQEYRSQMLPRVRYLKTILRRAT